jgi:hypothetical protein
MEWSIKEFKMSLQERFEKTKDGRIRFNAIFASFLIVFITIWILEHH